MKLTRSPLSDGISTKKYRRFFRNNTPLEIESPGLPEISCKNSLSKFGREDWFRILSIYRPMRTKIEISKKSDFPVKKIYHWRTLGMRFRSYLIDIKKSQNIFSKKCRQTFWNQSPLTDLVNDLMMHWRPVPGIFKSWVVWKDRVCLHFFCQFIF